MVDRPLGYARRDEIADLATAAERENLSGQIDGVVVEFQTAFAFVHGKLDIWINGLYLGPCELHFTETAPRKFRLLDYVPDIGEELTVRYLKA